MLARAFDGSQPTPTEHNITINCDPSDKGCQAKAESSKVAKGATVTLTATAGDGYEFDSYETSPQLTITDNRQYVHRI